MLKIHYQLFTLFLQMWKFTFNFIKELILCRLPFKCPKYQHTLFKKPLKIQRHEKGRPR